MDQGWAGLPADILDSLVDRLELVSDYLRFSVVCRPWYCVAMKNKTHQAKLELCTGSPMLLISADGEDTWDVYNVMDNKVLNLQLNLPNIHKKFCGGSKGWLITVEENFTVTLMNPFMRAKGERNMENSIIRLPQLPPLYTVPQAFVTNAAISADPILEADKCIVMVIGRAWNAVAFFRLGKDTTWTYFADADGNKDDMVDLIFVDHKNLGPNFFFLHLRRYLYSSRGASSTDVVCRVTKSFSAPFNSVISYLVDSNGGDPLLIERMVEYEGEYIDDETARVRTTVEFKVFEVNHYKSRWEESKSRWKETNTLGDDIAIFLGDNTAISVTASKFPGCEPNSIYFVRDLDRLIVDYRPLALGPGDYGVYSLETRSFSQRPYSTAVQTLLKNTALCPFWVEGLTPLQLKLI